MEPYRHLILDGDRAEELMNDRTEVFVNAPLALHATTIAGHIGMLNRLHERGLLRTPDEGPEALRAAYSERARLIAHLTKQYPSCYAYNDTAEPAWPVVYLHTPQGQLSWHIHPQDFSELFQHVPHDPHVTWDCHTATEKYQRLDALTSHLHSRPAPGDAP